jgi:hypothetical protein
VRIVPNFIIDLTHFNSVTMWTTVKQLARRTSSFARLPCWLSFKTLCIGTLKLFALLPSFVTASFFFGGVWGWREQDNWVIGAAHSSVLASACVLAPLRQLLSLCLSSICDIVMQECEKAFLSSTYFSSEDVPWSNDYLSTWVEYRNFYEFLWWVEFSRWQQRYSYSTQEPGHSTRVLE